MRLQNAVGGANGYLRLTFAANAGALALNASSSETQSHFNKSDCSNYDETDDNSFDPSKTASTDWNKATLYRDGALVWGTERVTVYRNSTLVWDQEP